MTSRDYYGEISAAMLSGDVKSLGELAMYLAGKVTADDERRERGRVKKQRQRASAAASPVVPGQAGTQGDMEGQEGTAGDSGRQEGTRPPLSPSPTPPTPNTPASSSSAPARKGEPWGEHWPVELSGADAATLATLEQRLATDGAKDALSRFMAAVPRSQRPGTWLPLLNGYLDGLGAPRMQAILPAQLAVAMLEFLVKGWEFNPNSFAAFVADVLQREEVSVQRLQERLTRSPGAGSGDRARPLGEIRERARRAWTLIKAHGFASCHPQFIASKVEQLVAEGKIADADGFRALLEALNPQRQALASARTDEFALRIIADVLAELPEAANAA